MRFCDALNYKKSPGRISGRLQFTRTVLGYTTRAKDPALLHVFDHFGFGEILEDLF